MKQGHATDSTGKAPLIGQLGLYETAEVTGYLQGRKESGFDKMAWFVVW